MLILGCLLPLRQFTVCDKNYASFFFHEIGCSVEERQVLLRKCHIHQLVEDNKAASEQIIKLAMVLVQLIFVTYDLQEIIIVFYLLLFIFDSKELCVQS